MSSQLTLNVWSVNAKRLDCCPAESGAIRSTKRDAWTSSSSTLVASNLAFHCRCNTAHVFDLIAGITIGATDIAKRTIPSLPVRHGRSVYDKTYRHVLRTSVLIRPHARCYITELSDPRSSAPIERGIPHAPIGRGLTVTILASPARPHQFGLRRLV